KKRRDFIEEVDEDDPLIGHYIPHHGVKKDSVTTPIRVVYDCSCKQGADYPSLNECLQAGPSLINDLPAILLRFRGNRIALTSDIEKAFLNVRLDIDDRKFTKFLWLTDVNDPNSDFKVYRFKTVLFGAVCSPFILNSVIKTHLENNNNIPTALNMSNNIYVDDVIDGTDTEESEANKLMDSGGFKLRAWSSNSQQVMDLAEKDNIHEPSKNVSILGIRWKIDGDVLTYNKAVKPILTELATKRDVVSYASSLYDPIGYLSPVLIKARLFIQLLWKLGFSWDEPLTTELTTQWIKIAENMRETRNITVKRQYFTENDPQSKVDVHAFADASSVGYGAIVYITNQRETAFVTAKTRVAPMTEIALPRLELMAALIASRLTKFVITALSGKFNINNCYLWSDSQIVLHWLNSDKKLPIFVRNRVKEINEIYKYVPTLDNPADLLTRGITCAELINSNIWWNGPLWLNTPNEWPTCEMFDITILHAVLERENRDLLSDSAFTETETNISRQREIVMDNDYNKEIESQEIGLHTVIDISRYNSIDKLLLVTAYVMRFISCVKKADTINTGLITADELKRAEHVWILNVQQQEFRDTIHELKTKHTKLGPIVQQLGLFIDEEDVLRCGSRIHNAPIEFVTKFPTLLPSNHELTKLIVLKAHSLILHGGVQSTVTQIRQQYWIPRIRQIVRSILRGCVTCRRVEGKAYANPVQAPLPSYRVNKLPAFTITGVDFTGFLLTKAPDGTRGKAYVCLFTCAVTRAIHLELVPDLSTRTLLHAFRRFAARRSLPSRMLSDNTSTYLSAAEEIRALVDTPEIREYLATHRVQWTFIPVVTEIETVLNDRPLTYVSSNLDDNVGLTPNHLLHGRQVTALPYINVSDEEIYDPSYTQHEEINDRYKHLSRLHVQFWTRWSTEYLTALRERHTTSGSKHNTIRVGEVVIIHSDIEKRLNWQLGTVTKLIYGND
ncbi:uncharacterized protein LOC102806229, partial [Saccoglossus kowalevskii]|uniref:Uncharacterized protein LOC102806229 n=1 Tax=Saccoglossus kowalevskii TaxID=10224 RepID=A0ABM0MX55_SACKO